MAGHPSQEGPQRCCPIQWSRRWPGWWLKALPNVAHACQSVFQIDFCSSCYRTSSRGNVLVLPDVRLVRVRSALDYSKSDVTYHLCWIGISSPISSYCIRVMDNWVEFRGGNVEFLRYSFYTLSWTRMGVSWLALPHPRCLSVYACGTFRWCFDCFKAWTDFLGKVPDLLDERGG